MEKEGKQAPTFESEADFFEGLKVVMSRIEELAENNSAIQKYAVSVGEANRFCEKTYKMNLELLQKADEFRAVILNNASKISTMIKVINSDQLNISDLKIQFDEKVVLLKKTQESILQSKELNIKLRKTVSELAEKVHKGEAFCFGEENSVLQVSHEVENLKKEKKKANEEIKEIKSELKAAQTKFDVLQQNLKNINETANNLQSILDAVESQCNKVSTDNESTSSDVMTLKPIVHQQKEMVENNKRVKNSKSRQINQLTDTKCLILGELGVLREATRVLKDQLVTRTKILTEIKGRKVIQTNTIDDTQKQLILADQLLSELKGKFSMIEKLTEESKLKFEEEKAEYNVVTEEKSELRRVTRTMRTELISKMFLETKSVNEVNQSNRINTAMELQVKQVKRQIHHQEKISEEIFQQGKTIKSETLGLKTDLQLTKEKILSLLEGIDSERSTTFQFESKANIQFDLTQQIMQQSISHQKELDEYQSKQKHQELLSEKLREERNSLKRSFVSISQENDNYIEQIEQLSRMNAIIAKESNKLDQVIFDDHQNSIMAQSISNDYEIENEHYKTNTFSVERIISRLQTQRQTLDFILTATEHDYMQQQKEHNALEKNIQLIQKSIHDRITQKDEIKSNILTLVRRFNKASQDYVCKVKQMIKNREELDFLSSKTLQLQDKRDRLNQKRFEISVFQASLLYERQKYSALLHEFSIPRNIHRWEIISAVDPKFASQLRYKAEITGKLDASHQILVALKQEKKELENKLKDLNSVCSRILSKDIVQKQMDIYAQDLQQKELMMKKLKTMIGSNQGEMNKSITHIDSLRGKLVEKRCATAVLRSRTTLASMKLSTDAQSSMFMTESQTATTPKFGGGYVAKEDSGERVSTVESGLYVMSKEPSSFRIKKSPLLSVHKKLSKPMTPHTGKTTPLNKL